MSAVQEAAGGWLGWKWALQVRSDSKWRALISTSSPQFVAHSLCGQPSNSTYRIDYRQGHRDRPCRHLNAPCTNDRLKEVIVAVPGAMNVVAREAISPLIPWRTNLAAPAVGSTTVL